MRLMLPHTLTIFPPMNLRHRKAILGKPVALQGTTNRRRLSTAIMKTFAMRASVDLPRISSGKSSLARCDRLGVAEERKHPPLYEGSPAQLPLVPRLSGQASQWRRQSSAVHWNRCPSSVSPPCRYCTIFRTHTVYVLSRQYVTHLMRRRFLLGPLLFTSTERRARIN